MDSRETHANGVLRLCYNLGMTRDAGLRRQWIADGAVGGQPETAGGRPVAFGHPVDAVQAGDRLIERELQEDMGVSRTLIREILTQLEAEGLVQIIPHKGPIVARYSREEAIAIYE